MGVVLDTSVPIKAQRMRMDEPTMLKSVRAITGDALLVTSTIVVTELRQGIWPASTPEIRRRRQQFFDEFLADISVHSFSLDIAQLAGKIGGEERARGETIPTIDLMIGATAIWLGFSLLTANLRHFEKLPGLHVIPF